MAITLITGVPGAGKTLYCVDKILRNALLEKVTHKKPDGTTEEIERTIYTNINGLSIDHIKIDDSAEHGINGWHKWCKPGDFIVFDEIQKVWPTRTNGSKVPDYIQHLETHRHMGVDIVVLTQGPGLVDQNLRALVGRHLHVRRMAGSHIAIIYEWDHCSRQLLFSNSSTRKPYRYNKSVFDLYKSSELHTKQTHTTPFLLYVVGAAVLAAAYFIPASYSAITNKEQKSKELSTMAKNNSANSPGINNVNARGIGGAHLPALNDLILVGHAMYGDNQHYVVFEWHENETYRAGLTSTQLTRYGYTVTIERECVVTLKLGADTKTIGCTPPPLRQTSQSGILAMNTTEEQKNGNRR